MIEQYTVWASAAPAARGYVKDAACRLKAMLDVSQMGGIQAGEHMQEGVSVYQNPYNVDWACWELLIALSRAGYGGLPAGPPDGPPA